MARPKSYENLILWQKAMSLARSTYKFSEGLPKSETYGLLAQIRRAAVSIPSNIAEGHGRLTDTQFRHFLGNARGSLYEMQTQIQLATDLGYIPQPAARELIEQAQEVGRILNALITSLSRKRLNSTRPDSADSANSADSASSL